MIKKMGFYSYCLIGSFVCSSAMQAANTQTFINNASGLGNAFAGNSAVTDDSSVQYYNPAGLINIDHKEVALGSVFANANRIFRGTTTYKPISLSQTGKVTAHTIGLLPFFYLNIPFGNRYAFGWGLSAFGGSGQVYRDNSILRYTSTKSSIGIIDTGPSIAARITNKISAGFAIDVDYLFTIINFMSPGSTNDAKVFNNAAGFGYGWHAGLLFSPDLLTKIGLAYRSRVNFHPKGDSTYITNPGSPLKLSYDSNTFNYKVPIAPTTSLSITRDITPCWTLIAGADYTQWSILKTETLRNIAFPPPTNLVSNTVTLNYRDTWHLGAAVNYKGLEKWILRAGIFTDQDPTDHNHLPADFVPNTDAVLLGVGARYQINKKISMDVGYARYFFKETNIYYNTAAAFETGKYQIQNSNLVGVQFNFII